MPTKARIYISLVVLIGVMLLLAAASYWHSVDTARYVTYLGLALLAATRKVQLPKLTGTIAPSFVFVLLAIAQCSFAETILLAAVTAVVQCCWKPQRRLQAIQVVFSAAAVVASAAFAYGATHGALAPVFAHSLSLELCVATTLYFVCNTVLVSAVICLIQGNPLTRVWEQCVSWSFPYYLAGAAIAGVMSGSSQTLGWPASLLALPLLYLVALTYRLCVHRLNAQDAQTVTA